MLETLAGPIPVAKGLAVAVAALSRGLQADQAALLTQVPDAPPCCRAFVTAGGRRSDASPPPALRDAAQRLLAIPRRDDVASPLQAAGRQWLAVTFAAPAGPTVLLAGWRSGAPAADATALMEDAAHSLRLALEREEAGLAHQEATALRRSQELQRGFLSRLSHELRTPLTAIRGYASSLMQPDVTWDRDSQQRFLHRIAAESARLGRLVGDLLDFSAIESGILRLQRDWCDISLVLDAAVACLPPAGAAMVEVDCDPSLPVVWADHDRLEQVFVNLLDNALGHNLPGTRVSVSAAAAGRDGISVSVLDDGAGMPPRSSARRSSRCAAAGRPAPALGSGCPSPRELSKLTGGASCWSSPGRGPGSGFTCPSRCRPAGRPACRAAARRPSPRGRAPASVPGRSAAVSEHAATTRALVVEDDPNIVDLIRSNLAVRGFDTVVSADGVRTLQLLETEEPDIVLLDLMLPEVDGFELCRQIRERSSVAIIVVSARGGERDKVTALNVGADDYMTKPFSIEELLARITATLRRTRPAAAPEAEPAAIIIGELVIDLASQQVTSGGQPVHLTPTEFALLRELATNRGKLLTHAHLLRRVWGHGYETETEYVRVYVRRLRAKLEVAGATPLILTQPRAGYRIAAE